MKKRKKRKQYLHTWTLNRRCKRWQIVKSPCYLVWLYWGKYESKAIGIEQENYWYIEYSIPSDSAMEMVDRRKRSLRWLVVSSTSSLSSSLPLKHTSIGIGSIWFYLSDFLIFLGFSDFGHMNANFPPDILMDIITNKSALTASIYTPIQFKF